MRNRPNSKLPTEFASSNASELDEAGARPTPLTVLEITYLHYHSSLELGVCLSGRGLCVVDDKRFSFGEGDAQIIFPFQKHLSRSEGEAYSQWYWLNIDPLRLLCNWGAPNVAKLEKLLYGGMGVYGIIDAKREPFIAELISRVIANGDKNMRLACLYALILELSEKSKGLPILSLRPEKRLVQLEAALEYVQTSLNQGEAASVRGMAEACAMSASPFRRAFRQAMGQSPQSYIQTCRMEKARQMLAMTDASITQIAQAVGYTDVSGFNRLFLETYGTPPRRYRDSKFGG